MPAQKLRFYSRVSTVQRILETACERKDRQWVHIAGVRVAYVNLRRRATRSILRLDLGGCIKALVGESIWVFKETHI